jgi:CheY-like chemotaxis protein
MKILIADDDQMARVMLKQMVSHMGHEAVLARNGSEAVQLFIAEAPDIVLMDVMMPEVDGFQATARIRELQAEKWVPVIFLSALERNKNLLLGLESGGDDYIVKPINLMELKAKIKALERVTVLQKNLAEKRQELEFYYQQAEEETRIGSHIMNRLVSMAGLKDESLQYWTRPLHHFSGDLVAAARTPANVLHVMLADAVGHGLPAALNVLPLADTFYAMTAAGYPLSRIVAELDKKIKQLLPSDRFVAATLVSVDVYSKTIQLWNGGNPIPAFVSATGQVRLLEKSRNLPLGLLRDHIADVQPEVIAYQEPGQVFLFSDGLCEAQSADGTMWGSGPIYDALIDAPPEARLEHIRDAFERHVDRTPIHDDVSLMLIDFCCDSLSVAPQHSLANEPLDSLESTVGWSAQIRFGARELKKIDAIPFLTSMVEKLDASSEHRRQIFMIFSELFNNALDHGLLQLSSDIKFAFDGFETYLAERARRLNALEDGTIEVALERVLVDEKPAIKISVKDSGEGFNHAATAHHSNADNAKCYGRGIMLVKSLCSSLQYLGKGNQVVSYYVL